MNLVPPESNGFSSKRLGRIRTGMQRFVDEGKQAGLMTLLERRGQVVHFDMVGMLDCEAGQALRLDALLGYYWMWLAHRHPIRSEVTVGVGLPGLFSGLTRRRK